MKLIAHILLVALLLTAGAEAARNSDIPARVALKDQSGAVDVVLTGKRKDTIHARLKDADTGSVTFEAEDIKRILISLPEEPMLRAEALAAAGNGPQALKMIRAVVRPVIAYLDLPIDGAVEPALRYAAIARQEKAWSEAISIYKAMQQNPDAMVSDQGIGWLAYCYVKNLQPGEAKKRLELFQREDPRNPGFIPATIAESLLSASENNDEAALDLAARASALARIGHELYPEAVYLSAESYYRMSKAEHAKTEEKEVVLSKDTEASKPVPAMYPEEFLAVATNQYARVIELFPSSPVSIQASNTLGVIEEELRLQSEESSPTGNGDQP